MARPEGEQHQAEPVNRRKERSHRTEYWTRKFISAIHPDYSEVGLTQTQIPTIKRLITTIVARTESPGEIINPLLPTDEMREEGEGQELWELLNDLMHATEQVTGERHIYTPGEFVASLKGFSDAQVARYRGFAEATRSAQILPAELELDEARRDVLKKQIDQIVDDPDFFEYHSNEWRHRPEYTIYIDEDILSEPNVQENNRIHGIVRSFPTCNTQSEYLIDYLPTTAPDLGFLYASGLINPHIATQEHHIVIALPDRKLRDEFLAQDTERPSIMDATVIDASILQLFDHIPFLDDMPHEDRIPFVQTLAPDSFSDHGVFVDSFINYVRFLGLLGSYNPGFDFTEHSWRRMHGERRTI